MCVRVGCRDPEMRISEEVEKRLHLIASWPRMHAVARPCPAEARLPVGKCSGCPKSVEARPRYRFPRGDGCFAAQSKGSGARPRRTSPAWTAGGRSWRRANGVATLCDSNATRTADCATSR